VKAKSVSLDFSVMYSFQKEASTIVDHHTCSKQFLTHDEREKRCGREVPAQWSWIVPPLSSSLTGVFHHEMRDFHLTPEYVYQANMWEIKAKGSKISDSSLHAGHDSFSAKVLILWSSETGTAERFAKLAKHTMERYMECDARSLAGLRASDLASLSSDYLAVLFIVSTFGDGAPPSDGVDLHSSLNTLVLSEAAPAPEPLLSKLRFSVLALGSSLYPHFCGFGLNLDSLLLTCGAFSLLPPTLADELKGQAATFQTWMSQVTHVLGVEGGGGNASAATPISPLHFISKLELTASAEGTSGKVDDAYFSCSVRKNVELLFGRAASEAREGSDTTRMIEIDMSGTPLTYETGDHLQIMPCNSQATVVAMLKHLHLRGNEWVAEGKKGSMSLLPVAFPVQVGTLLSRAIDLSSTEASLPGFLNLLRVRSKDERDLEYVQGLLNRWASQSHRQSLLAEFPTILHLLQVCTSAQLELGDLALLPVLKPRLYSISSAAECMPHTVQLTVKVIREGSSVGLCSNFLAGLAPGSSTVMARIHTSSFRLPSDLSSPLILVGAGTGIAPLIAFLRRREHAKFQQGAQLGPCLVYFGCRDPDYFLYRQQLQRWRWMGVITDLQVAYSRAHGKVYVQDLIFSQKVKVWRLLSLPTTHSFVCGDAAIAQAVQLEFCHIASETGGMESCLVGKWFKSLQESGRYTADAWGMKKPRKDEDLVVVRTSVYKPRHHPPSCSAM
jgi:sulfite reductase alpha subunit-like flavoprotein